LRTGRTKRTRRHPSRSEAKTTRSAPAPALVSFPIVGVGASAGGLDAFRQLLAALPIDTGMAFVLVQHLDASHESLLAELLAKGSRMPVSEVSGDTVVEPDHVYVTPGRNDIAIEGDVLKLVPRVTTGGRHLPIDSFLCTPARRSE
jgi:two-component system CheB/CheR fusion protein